MERIVLITDVDTPLGYSLSKFYIKDGEKVIGTISSRVSELPFADLDKDTIDIVEWHRSSPLESKNLLIHIIKKYRKLDEAFVIQSVKTGTMNLHETGLPDIEKGIDHFLKGLFFICREIIKTYVTQQRGALYIINYNNKEQGISPVSETIKAGTMGFIRNLLCSYEKNAFHLNIFESSYTACDAFSAYIYKNIKERLRGVSGKQVKFHRKPGLFSGLKKARKKE